jgi:hypothetical protein
MDCDRHRDDLEKMIVHSEEKWPTRLVDMC